MLKSQKNNSIVKKKNITQKRKKKSNFKFDLHQILKERKAEENDEKLWKRSEEEEEEMRKLDELFKKKVKSIFGSNDDKVTPPKFGLKIFDHSKYNLRYNDIIDSLKSDTSKLNSIKLLEMSVEVNEFEAHIHYSQLIKAEWSPTFDDVKNILHNWGAELDTLFEKPLLKCPMNEDKKLRLHNFEFTLNFLSLSIQKNINGFNKKDLITLAKIAYTMYYDYHCRQMASAIKSLFNTCIKTAFCESDEADIILFAQELYLLQEEIDNSQIIIILFLPLEGNIPKIIYSYMSFKLFNSLLGKTDNIKALPSSINDWFVQDVVDQIYFKQNPEVIESVVKLLEHVVITFDLYQDEEKLNYMYELLNKNAKRFASSNYFRILNTLEQWQLRLFRLHMNRHKHLFS